jgi:hypothetical protein
MEEEQIGSTYRILCPGCKAATRWFENKMEAKAAWNHRKLNPVRKTVITDEEEVPPTA